MSYAITYAKAEEMTAVETAVEQRDVEGLFKLARVAKKAGNDEFAEILVDNAKRIDREDWAYDEAVDNNL